MRHLHILTFIFLLVVFMGDFAQAQRAGHRGAFSATINPDKKYPYYSALDITDAINQNKPDRVLDILNDYSGSESYLDPLALREFYRENKFIQETFFIPDSINRPTLYQKKIKSDSVNIQPAPPPVSLGRSIDNDGNGGDKSSLLKSIGGLDATIVADAFAKIVVKRFKQDVNEIFFEQMKTAMDSTVELTVLLPHTHQLLQLVDKDIYNFQPYIDGLRQKLEEDFSNIFAGTNALLETPKYKNRFTKDIVSQSIISTMLQVSDGLVNKRQPGIIIEQLNLNGNYDQNEEGRNIKQGLQMLQIFSGGLQSKYPDHYWVSGLDSLNMLFKGDTNVGKVWLGLLCQSVKPDTLSKGKLNKTLRFSKEMTMHDAIHKMYYEPAYYTQSQNFFGSLINQVNQIELTVTDIKESGKKGTTINWSQAVSVYENAVSLIKLAPEIKTIFNKNYVLPQHWTRGLFIAETMPRVYAEMKGKQYHAAVQHIAGLIKAFDFSELYTKGTIKVIQIDTIRNGIAAPKLLSYTKDVEKVFRIDTMRSFFYVNDAGEKQPRHEYCDPVGNFIKCDSVFIPINKIYLDPELKKERTYSVAEKFLKYGGFCASLVESRTSDEVAALLDATMTPPGGTRLKETGMMLGINGYLGLQHSFSTNDSLGFSSITAPLGINLSFGIPRNTGSGLTKSEKFWDIVSPHTIQFFASIVDVGALAGLRFSNNRTDLPKITLENIFSPGLFLQFGRMFKIPLNVGVGYQAQPRLYNISGQNLTLQPFVFRFNINASWDIPFWNLLYRAN